MDQLFEIDLSDLKPILQIGKVKVRREKPTEKHIYSFTDKSDYMNYISFYVSTSHGNCKYQFCQTVGLDFKELGEYSVNIHREFDKYIRDTDIGEIDMFEDEYWLTALYELGGYVTGIDFESEDYVEYECDPVNLTLERAIKNRKTFDEGATITLPKEAKKLTNLDK